MSGIDIMLDTIAFEEVLKDTSMVITGEERLMDRVPMEK